ncbi:MAG: glutamate formimidoyltransferase [Actinomycetota bacterium]
MLECVANVSEGRDLRVLRSLADACGSALIDVHADADHHRSVFTLAGPGARDAEAAARHLARAVVANVDISSHAGQHPRFGVLDVLPFAALGGTDAERQVAAMAARSFARWWAETFEIPVFCYDDADPEGRDLPHARLHGFRARPPDFGPERPHPQLGATAVGARRPLVAINCLLITKEVEIARRIARAIRHRDGGLPGVRALGFLLESEGRAQVSMNLVDLNRTGVEEACLHVRDLALGEETNIAHVELVGLLPRAELDRCSDEFLEWSGLDAEVTIEARIDRGPSWRPDPDAGVEPADDFKN